MTNVPSEQDLAALLEDLDPEQMQRVVAYLMQLLKEDVE